MDERRDDWKHGVDENLASLNAGQRIRDRDLDSLQERVSEIDSLLRGDTEEETDGLISRLHAQEKAINMFRAIIDVDKAGNRGLVSRVEALEHKDKTTVEKWKLVVALISLLGAIAVAVITNLDKIQKFLKQKDPVEEAIERAKHPPRRHIRIRIDARTKPSDESPEQSSNGE